jgi:dihydrofolate reductase
MILSIIVAMTPNRVIGANNRLLWRLPAELQYFKKTTWGKPIIMGRKTHESIGRALPGRRNIIISHNPYFQAEGCEILASLEAALTLVEDSEEVMVIGGAQIYAQALPRAQRLYLTRVHHEFAGDTYFPEWKASQWRELSREDRGADADNPHAVSFVILERVFNDGLS